MRETRRVQLSSFFQASSKHYRYSRTGLVFQLLKAVHRDNRLDFTKGWVAKTPEMAEENTDGTCTMESMSVVDIDTEKLRELLISGKVAEVSNIIMESLKVL